MSVSVIFSSFCRRDEFDFLPVTEPKQNRSPVVLVEHKLALELWSVKILFQYAYHTLLAWRSKESHKFSGTVFLLKDTPGSVAQFVGHLICKSEVLGSIPGLATYFRFSFC